MTVKIKLANTAIVLLKDKNNQEDSAMCNIVDVEYCHRWLGDSWFGPGTVGIDISLSLKRSFIIPSC